MSASYFPSNMHLSRLEVHYTEGIQLICVYIFTILFSCLYLITHVSYDWQKITFAKINL